MSPKRLTGRTAVVTGGSRGIGARTAAALANEGARVISLSRTPPEKRIDHLECDVTEESSVAAAAKAVTERFGGAPDIVVNNAGHFLVGALAEMSIETFTRTLETNLLGPFLVLHAFLPDMRRRGSGHIVTIGSIADRTIYPEGGAYAAAKFGVRAMHEVLRAELRGSGVRATLVSPAQVDTPIWDTFLDGPEAKPTGGIPPRDLMLRPDDVAAAIIFALTQPDSVNVDELRLSHS